MICLSCGSIFEDPLVLSDGLGLFIHVCPNCRSTEINISQSLKDRDGTRNLRG